MKKRMEDNKQQRNVKEPTMNQAEFEQAEARNRQAYEKLRDQIRRDYTGQYVGIAEGRLIAAANTFEEVQAALDKLQPVPEYFLIFPADEEPPFEPYDDTLTIFE
jgi:hypothetical protein